MNDDIVNWRPEPPPFSYESYDYLELMRELGDMIPSDPKSDCCEKSQRIDLHQHFNCVTPVLTQVLTDPPE